MSANEVPEPSPEAIGEHLVYLGLGSNIQPEVYLPQALTRLRLAMEILQVSTAWDTPAFGSEGPDFLNAALIARTSYSIPELKTTVIRPIESALGRVRTSDKNAPRTIDIDVLIYDGAVIEPEIWRCAFLAVPLAELAPDYANPATGKSLAQIAAQLKRITRITPRPEVLGNV